MRLSAREKVLVARKLRIPIGAVNDNATNTIAAQSVVLGYRIGKLWNAMLEQMKVPL